VGFVAGLRRPELPDLLLRVVADDCCFFALELVIRVPRRIGGVSRLPPRDETEADPVRLDDVVVGSLVGREGGEIAGGLDRDADWLETDRECCAAEVLRLVVIERCRADATAALF
jgi:hypothetical protein